MENARMLGTEQVVAGGTEGGRSPTGVPPATTASVGPGCAVAGNGKLGPDPAVLEKPVRRRFTAEYKLRILHEADRSTASGQLGALLATAPNQVWSWDITKLLAPTKWTYFHLYVILDIFSRYVVGWMLASRESEHLAERLIRETVVKQGVIRDRLTLHSDRGPSMRSQTVAQLLATLGITKSHSRPHVSDDNPFSESQFKTMKYQPEFPDRFTSIEHGLEFCGKFIHWQNHEHHHWGLGLLTPAMVHYGQAAAVLAARQTVLTAA